MRPGGSSDGQDAKLAWSFADEVAQTLERCGIDMYTAAPGEPFDPIRHNPAGVLDSPDEALHNTVAEVTAAGFIDRETGRVRAATASAISSVPPGAVR